MTLRHQLRLFVAVGTLCLMAAGGQDLFADPVIKVAQARAPDESLEGNPTSPAVAMPVEAPPTPSRETWPALIGELSNRDPAVRQSARERLMLLARDDLPALRETIEAVGPLSPAQRALLRDVVLHVHMTGVHNFKGIGNGFLGVRGSNQDSHSLLVRETFRGRDAHRVLLPSDIVLGIRDDMGKPFSPTPNIPTLQSWLATRSIGKWVNLSILRGGTQMEVKIRLGPTTLVSLQGRQAMNEPDANFAEAEQYWSDNFAALSGPTTRPSQVSTTLPAR